jgi:hypothetical protein
MYSFCIYLPKGLNSLITLTVAHILSMLFNIILNFLVVQKFRHSLTSSTLDTFNTFCQSHPNWTKIHRIISMFTTFHSLRMHETHLFSRFNELPPHSSLPDAYLQQLIPPSYMNLGLKIIILCFNLFYLYILENGSRFKYLLIEDSILIGIGIVCFYAQMKRDYTLKLTMYKENFRKSVEIN